MGKHKPYTNRVEPKYRDGLLYFVGLYFRFLPILHEWIWLLPNSIKTKVIIGMNCSWLSDCLNGSGDDVQWKIVRVHCAQNTDSMSWCEIQYWCFDQYYSVKLSLFMQIFYSAYGCCFDSLAPVRCGQDRYIEHFLWNCPEVNAAKRHWWLFKIGSGNGLVPSHCLNPCWPSSMTEYNVVMTQWVYIW